MAIHVRDLEEMGDFAASFVLKLKPGEVFGFSGELGAGKTTLVQLIGRELGIATPMTSPTFVFRKEYPIVGRAFTKLVHIDAYRIEGGNAEDLGDLSEPDAVTVIEWPEKIERLLPQGTHRLDLQIGADESRIIHER
jgi:tRNA threonylcarbamoyladenosine biosynthesis protein TsaE